MRMSPLFTAVVALALAAPGLAQRKPDAVPTVKTTAPFLARFGRPSNRLPGARSAFAWTARMLPSARSSHEAAAS